MYLDSRCGCAAYAQAHVQAFGVRRRDEWLSRYYLFWDDGVGGMGSGPLTEPAEHMECVEPQLMMHPTHRPIALALLSVCSCSCKTGERDRERDTEVSKPPKQVIYT